MAKKKEVVFGRSKLKKSKIGFRNHCKAYGIRRSLSEEDAEDFAQQCLIYTERGWTSTIPQMFSDYIREKTEWSRTLKTRKAEFIQFDDKLMDKKQQVKNGNLDEHGYIDFEKLVSKVKDPKLRMILRLRYKWGFTLKEIGSLIDVTESRMSQFLSRALQQLKKDIVITPVSSAGEA